MITKHARTSAVHITLSVLLLGWSLATYSQTSDQSGATKAKPDIQRWYDPRRVVRGTSLYAKNCSVCHGKSGEGAPGWQGTALPPPLNGTGHTWHHPDQMLFEFTKYGPQKFAGADYKSKMPAYDGTLTDEEIWNVLAYIKSKWPNKIQRKHTEAFSK